MVGELPPNSSHLNRELVKYVPGRVYFRAVSSQNGGKFVTSPPPPQSSKGSNALCLSLSSRCLPRFLRWFFRRDGRSTLITPRLLHFRHFCFLVYDLLSLDWVLCFPRRRCTNFAAAGMVAAGNDFILVGLITTCQCCWTVCTVSIDEFLHQSMSLHDVD